MSNKLVHMEPIKNIIYAGVGLATTATDKVKETVNDLVEKGKISDTEGKRIIDDIFKTTENTKEEFEAKIKSISEKFSSAFGGKKEENDEVENLKKKVEELEKKLAEAKKKTTKPATRAAKAPAKKTPAARKKTTTSRSTTKKTEK